MSVNKLVCTPRSITSPRISYSDIAACFAIPNGVIIELECSILVVVAEVADDICSYFRHLKILLTFLRGFLVGRVNRSPFYLRLLGAKLYVEVAGSVVCPLESQKIGPQNTQTVHSTCVKYGGLDLNF